MCLTLFLVNTHIGMLDLLQDLSSILGNLLSLKRGMFSFFSFFFCKSVESLTEHEWVPGSHVTIE